ncbi:MAG: hypothetical protein IPN95_03050 [Bacteroidetes bacterium]|nr:hypothetical protein [Bacteroidota bacterium]
MQQRLIEAAQNAGITVQDLSVAWGQEAVKFTHAGQTEIVFQGSILGSNSHLGTTICSDLPITRFYLAELAIPTPASKVFKLDSEQTSTAQLERLIGEFWIEGKIYRCLPAFSVDGHGVASNLKHLQDLELHLDTFADDYATWLLEEQAEGEDLELLIIGGELVSGITRTALRLTGDGVQTLEELIDRHNITASESDKVQIDAETRQLLRDQAAYLSEVVLQGVAIQVKNPGGGGGGATDVTDKLHRTYLEWAKKISDATGLKAFSVKLKCESVSSDASTSAKVLSLNAKPDWMAFQNALGNNQDFAKILLAEMFAMVSRG